MARIRTLKREFFESPTVVALPTFRCRLTFAGLICCYVDDHGRGRDDARLIRAAVWPLDDDVTTEDVAEDLAAINMAGLIVRYDDATSGVRGLRSLQARNASRSPVVQPVKYLALLSWKEHQRVSHPTKSKYPAPPAISRKPPKNSELFAPEVDLIRSGSGKGSGSRTRARKTPRRSEANGNGSVQAHEPEPEAPISDEVRQVIADAKAKTAPRAKETG